MNVIMLNRDISNKSMKEDGPSCEGSLRIQGQIPGIRNQATMNKTSLNADNEDNVMVLGEKEREDLFENNIEITSFNGFHVNHQMKVI